MGKGSKPRPVDREAYEEGFDRIFSPKEKEKEKEKPKSFARLLEEHFGKKKSPRPPKKPRKPGGGGRKVTATAEKREAARKKRAAAAQRAKAAAAAKRAKRAAAKAAAAALAKKMEEERANAPFSPLREAPLTRRTTGGGAIPYPLTPDVVLAPFSKENQTTIIRAARGMVEGTLTIPEVVVENAVGGEGRAAEKLRRDLLAAAGSYAKALQ